MKGIIFSARKVEAMLADPEREWQTRRLGGLEAVNAKMLDWQAFGHGDKMPQTGEGAVDILRALAHSGAASKGKWLFTAGNAYESAKPHYKPGETLYVKEKWRTWANLDHLNGTEMAAKCIDAGYQKPWAWIEYGDGKQVNRNTGESNAPGRWRHRMPEWASRLTITVTEVRVERVNQISDDDIEAEGISAIEVCSAPCCPCGSRTECNHYKSFRDLWNSINPKHPFDSGPWVWVYTYKVTIK